MENVNVNSKHTGLYWLWLSVFVVIADQVTKYLITSYLSYNQQVYVFPFFNLLLEHNRGAAFSFLSHVGPLALWIFIATATIISLILCLWLYRLPPKSSWMGISIALILGGAVGNLIDRIAYGYVIDFLHLHVQNYSWPIFNVADCAITIGAVMLIIDLFRGKSK